ncbi:LysM peptidoglycan-binding domain-containing protein [Chitinimonas arctica]|uniref:LysM peptidoglycan-binding domain-containing protein n=1 Tax=Chitinimonas arctica TaxID=2594795 RepID=A0A516SC59_9NEIS|nr:FG-GAP-like repeat-containing protein [Chitinimonas arctica]QDQ25733.1 LysM peptidoglycan-binding domain-containing protein [Chitinimonas arctica]
MVTIVAGQDTALFNGTVARLGAGSGIEAIGQAGEGVAINIARGNLVVQRRDEILQGKGLASDVLRTYNSQAKFSDDNADAWWLGGYRLLRNLTGTVNTIGSKIERITADGSVQAFGYVAAAGGQPARYVSQDGDGAHDSLSYDGSTWTWQDGSSRLQERYQLDGSVYRLNQVKDAAGNTVGYSFSNGLLTRTVHANGDSVDYVYTGRNLSQEKLTRADGGIVSRTYYHYDAQNRLDEVKVDLTPDDNSIADGKVYLLAYTYDGSSNRLASISQTDGSKLSFTYKLVATDDYRVETVTDGLGQITRFAYDLATRTTTVTDPLSYATRYRYDAQNRLVEINGPTVDGLVQKLLYVYDVDGNLSHSSDALGNAVTYSYDANGNQLSQQSNAGVRIERSYDAANQLLTETRFRTPDPDGAGSGLAGAPATTRYSYDAKQNLRFMVSAEGRVTEYRYDGFGQRSSQLSYLASVYPLGALAKHAAPSEAELAAWAASQPASQLKREDYSYDARGQRKDLVRYTAVDNVGAGVSAGSSKTSYTYDLSGRLLTQVDASGRQLSHGYDGLGRLLSTLDSGVPATSTLHQYDDAGRRIIHTQRNGRIDTDSYDLAGQLIGTIQGGAGPVQYRYDANGNRVALIDADGVLTRSVYDGNNRLRYSISATGAVVEQRYDAAGRPTQQVAYATPLADTGTMALSLATMQALPRSADDRNSYQLYDVAGRLAKQVDAEGFVTEWRYDGAGQLLQETRYETRTASTVTATSTAESVLVTPAAGDRTVRSFYDADGKLLGQLDAEGFLSLNEYDSAGRLVHSIRFATASPLASRVSGTLASLTPAAAPADQHDWYLYDGQDRVQAKVDAEGYLTELQYDTLGNKTKEIAYATAVNSANLAIGKTLANIKPATSGQDQVKQFSYTPRGELATETAIDGTVTRYSYNSAGQLIRKDAAYNDTFQLRSDIVEYDLLGRVTRELSSQGVALLEQDGTAVRAERKRLGYPELLANLTAANKTAISDSYAIRHDYDSAGRRIVSTDGRGNKTRFYYDAVGRLVYSLNGLGEISKTEYDAFGQVSATRLGINRLPPAVLAGLNGGLLTTAINSLIWSSASLEDRTSKTSYTLRGQVKDALDSLGNTTSQRYNAFGELAGSTAPIEAGRTLVSSYSYDRRGLRLQSVADVGGLNATTSSQYDAFGRQIAGTDARGKTSTSAFDRLGRTVLVTDPNNATRKSSYDAFDRVLTQTDALGHTTSFSYDNATRRITVTTAEGIVSSSERNRHGEIVTLSDGKGQQTRYNYDADGQLTRVTDGLGQSSDKAYDAAGNLVQTTDANGTVTLYSFDAANRQFKRQVDPAGLNLTTSYTFDGRGRTVTATDAKGTVTRNEYDRNGQLKAVVVDDGAGKLNLRTEYSYDAQGHTLSVTQGAGKPEAQTTQYVYDNLGRRTQEIVDPAGLKLTTRYEYNRADQVIAKRDALGNTSRFVYDAAGQLTHSIDPLGAVVSQQYDAAGRVSRTVAYAKTVNLSALPVLADAMVGYSASQIDALLSTDPADRINRTVYDKDGRAIYNVDALGAVTELRYDAAGKLISRLDYAKQVVGNWTSRAELQAILVGAAYAGDANNRVSHSVFDAAGQVVYSVDPLGNVIGSSYDGNGNLTSQTRYALAHATPASLTAGSSILRSENDQITYYVYDNANRRIGQIDAAGATTEYSYDAVGKLIKTTSYASLAWDKSQSYDILAQGDFNGDGNTDLYVNSRTLGGVQHILYGTDNGGFSDYVVPPLHFSWSGYQVLATGDFNGDGRTDLYLNYANLGGGAAQHIWYGQANGGFADTSVTKLDASWSGYKIMATGDFNGDGKTDLYLNTSNLAGGNRQHIWYGQSGTGFSDTSLNALDAGWVDYQVLASGDFNGDGKTDLYLNRGNLGSGAAQHIWYGGASGFNDQTVAGLAAGWTDYQVLASGDFDGDGKTDLYLNSSNLGGGKTQHIWYGQASTGFIDKSLPALHASWAGYQVLANGDFNNDGKTDLYLNTASLSSGAVQHFWYGQAANGGFSDISQSPLDVTAFKGYQVLATGNFDGAGGKEVLLGNRGAASLHASLRLWQGNGTQGFSNTSPLLRPNWRSYVETLPKLSPEKNRSTQYVYDAAGRQIYAVDAVGAVTETRYDAAGNVSSRIAYAAAVQIPSIGSSDGKTLTFKGLQAVIKGTTFANVNPAKTYKIRATLRQLSGTGSVYVGVVGKDGTGKELSNSGFATFSYAAAAGVPLTPEMGWRTFEGEISGESAVGIATNPNKFFTGTASAAPLILYNYGSDTSGDLSRLLEVDTVELIDIATGAILNPNSKLDGGAANWQVIAGGFETVNPSDNLDAALIKSLLHSDAAKDRISSFSYDAAGRQRFAIDPEGYVSETRYDGEGKVVATARYDKRVSLPTGASSSAILAALGSSATLSALPPQMTRLPNGTLAVNSGPGTSDIWPSASTILKPMGNSYRAELTLDSSGTSRYFYFGIDNDLAQTNPAYRRHAVSFQGNSASVSYFDAATSTKLGENFGTVKDGASYVVEIETDERGSTLYLYEKGKVRSAGLVDRRDQPNWNSAQARIYGHFMPGMAGNSTTVVERLQEVTPTQVTRYSYDAAGRRIQTTDALGNISKTSYDVFGQAIADTDALGNTSRAAYDTAGRLQYRMDAHGALTQYQYDAAGQTTRETRYATPLSTTVTGAWQPSPVTNAQDRSSNYVYDKAGRRTQTTDPLGQTSKADYDAQGNVIARTDALGNKTQYVHDAMGRQRFVIDAEGFVSENRYDALGNLASTARYDKRVNLTTPTETTVLAALAAWTQDFATNASGLTVLPVGMALVNGALAITSGNHSSTASPTVYGMRSNPLGTGYRAEITLDGISAARSLMLGIDNGQAGNAYRRHFIDIRGTQAFSHYYDRVSQANVSTQIGSVSNGKIYVVEIITDALGSTLYLYQKGTDRSSGLIDRRNTDNWDNSRLAIIARQSSTLSGSSVTLVEQLQETLPVDITEFSYDKNGRRTQTTDALGNISKLEYDALGNLRAQIDALGYRTEFSYDAIGQRIETSDAKKQLSKQGYDAYGNLTSTTDALGNITRYIYDALGQRTQVIQANGLTTTTAYDATGHALSVQQADSRLLGTSNYVYDKLGRLVKKTDQIGAHTFYLYDSASRQVGEISADGTVVEMVYNQAGQLTRRIVNDNRADAALLAALAANPTSKTLADFNRGHAANDLPQTLYFYDQANQLQYEVAADGAVTEYRYDKVGQRIALTRYAKPLNLDTLLAALGSPADSAPAKVAAQAAAYGADSANNRQTRYFFSSEGQLQAVLDAEGYLTEYRFDAKGQQTGTTRYATATDPAQRAAGTLLQLRPAPAAADQVSRRLYSATGQLEGTIDAEGALVEYRYDTLGNKYAEVRYAHVARNLLGASLGDCLPTVLNHPENQTTYFRYDALNRLVQEEQHPQNIVTSYGYDQMGKLTKVVSALSSGEERTKLMRYDSRGQLVAELSGVGSAKLPVNPTEAQIAAQIALEGSKHTYDAAGRRIATVDGAGRRTVFFYDAMDRLTHTVNADGEVRQTDYNSRSLEERTVAYATRITAANGLYGLAGGKTTPEFLALVNNLKQTNLDQSVQRSYNLRGQQLQSNDALGLLSAAVYNTFGEATETRSLKQDGSQTVIRSSYDRRGLLRTTTQGVATAEQRYDAFGRVFETVDALGKLTKTGYDRAGRIVGVISADGSQRLTAYDGLGRIYSIRDANGQTTRYSFDSAKRQMTITSPEGVTVTTTHNAHGEQYRIKDGTGHVTQYHYNRDGQLISKVLADNETAADNRDFDIPLSYSYDRAGNRVQEFANDIVTNFTYDAANRIVSRTLAPGLENSPGDAGLTTTYLLDGIGRAIWSKSPDGIWTRTEFDARGRVKATIVDSEYDPNAVPKAGALALRTEYSYTPAGQVASITEAAGTSAAKVTSYSYDELGRRLSETVDSTRLKLTTRYEYDAAGNVSARYDALNHATRFVYDAAGRIRFTIDPLGNVSERRYDAAGQLIEAVRYAKPIVVPASLTEATLIAALPVQTPQTREPSTRYAYDKDGRLTHTVDPLGFVTALVLDAQGAVVQRSEYAKPVSTSWNNQTELKQQIAQQLTADDRHSYTVFDKAGRATFAIDAEGYVTQSSYDLAGHVVESSRHPVRISLSAPPTAAQVVTALNTVTAANPTLVKRTDRYVYDAAGRQRFHIDAAGYVSESRYDKAGRERFSIRYPAIPTLTVYDERRVIQALPATLPAQAVVTEQRYDAAGRVIETIDAMGTLTRNRYDARGLLSDRTVAADTTEASTLHFDYDSAGQLIRETKAYGSKDALATEYTLDGKGQRTAIRSASGTTKQWFDANGRVFKTENALGHTKLVDYDAFGNAVKLTDARGFISYRSYDRQNQLIQEIDNEHYLTGYTYDGFGNVIGKTRYAQQVQGTQQGLVKLLAPGAAIPGGGAYLYLNALQDANWNDRFDKLDRRLESQDAGGANQVRFKESFGYNAFGEKETAVNKLGGQVRYSYDALGRLLRETLPVNALNAQGVAVAVVNEYDYDAFGNRIRSTEAKDLAEQRVTSYGFDKLGRQISKLGAEVDVVDPLSMTQSRGRSMERTIYDRRGNVIETQTGLQDGASPTLIGSPIRTLAYHDLADRKVADLNAAGFLVGRQYDSNGFVVAQTAYATPIALPAQAGGMPPVVAANAADRTLTFQNDALGRQVVETSGAVVYGELAGGSYQVYSGSLTRKTYYDAAGNVIEEVDRRGNSSFSFYDGLGRKVAAVDQERYLTRWNYNGNIVTEQRFATAMVSMPTRTTAVSALAVASGATDRTTVSEMDKLGRLVNKTTRGVRYNAQASAAALSGDATVHYDYDGLGNVVAETDADLNTSRKVYDKLGRVVETRSAQFTDQTGANVQRISQIAYTGLGAQASETQLHASDRNADRVVRMQYDEAGRLKARIDAEGHITHYGYDRAGNQARTVVKLMSSFGNEAHTDSTYIRNDVLGREIGRLTQRATVTTTRDANGNVVSTKNSSQQGDLSEIRYNAFGEITGKRIGGGGLDLAWQEWAEYDVLGRVVKSNSNGGVATIYVHDANGNATAKVESATADLASVQNKDVRADVKTITVFDKRNLSIQTVQPDFTVEDISATLSSASVSISGGVNISTGGKISVSVLKGVPAATLPVVGNATLTAIPPLSSVPAIFTVAVDSRTVDVGDSATRTLNSIMSGSINVSLPQMGAYGMGGYEVIYRDQGGADVKATAIATAGSVNLAINRQMWGNYSITVRKFLDANVYETVASYAGSHGGLQNANVASGSFSVALARPAQRSLQLTGLPPGTDSINLFSRKLNDPAALDQKLTLVRKSGANGSVADWFTADLSGLAAGDHSFRYEVLNSQGVSIAGGDGLLNTQGSVYLRQPESAVGMNATGPSSKPGIAVMEPGVTYANGLAAGQLLDVKVTGEAKLENVLVGHIKDGYYVEKVTSYRVDSFSVRIPDGLRGLADSYELEVAEPGKPLRTATASRNDSAVMLPLSLPMTEATLKLYMVSSGVRTLVADSGLVDLRFATPVVQLASKPFPQAFVIRGLNSDVGRLLFHYRESGGSGAYTTKSLARNPASATFTLDPAALGLQAGKSYEYHYTGLTANGVNPALVLARQTGLLSYAPVGATFTNSQTPPKIGGNGYAFFDDSGKLNFVDQGRSSLASIPTVSSTLRIRPKGRTDWTPMGNLPLRSDGLVSGVPGWFVCDPAAFTGDNYRKLVSYDIDGDKGEFDFELTSYDSSGNVTNAVAGRMDLRAPARRVEAYVAQADFASTAALYPNQVTLTGFIGDGASNPSRLSLGYQSINDGLTDSGRAAPVGTILLFNGFAGDTIGTFNWNANASNLVPDATKNYQYRLDFESLNGFNRVLTKGSVKVYLGPNGNVVGEPEIERTPTQLRFLSGDVNAKTARFYYRVKPSQEAGRTADDNDPLNSISPFAQRDLAIGTDGYFEMDASHLRPAAGQQVYEYAYELLDANGNVLARRSDTFALGDGAALSTTEMRWTYAVTGNHNVRIARQQSYDAFGQVISETDGLGRVRTLSYNALGLMTERRDAAVASTDERGTISTVTPTTQMLYSKAGRQLGTVDANGNAQFVRLDAAGQQIEEIHADGGKVAMKYDAFGQVRERNETLKAGNHTTRYDYDKRGLLVQVTEPSRMNFRAATGGGSTGGGYTIQVASPVQQYIYDALGRRLSARTREQGSVMAADVIDNVITTSDYDLAGRIARTRDGGVVTDYKYVYKSDIVGLGGQRIGGYDLTTTIAPLAEGQTGPKNIAVNTATSHLDAQGRLTVINAERSQVDRKDYFGHTTQHVDQSGRTTLYQYNRAGWLTQQTSTNQAGQALQNLTFDQYSNGYVKSIRDNVLKVETVYGYDHQGNRSFEGYRNIVPAGSSVEYYQSATISYDAANRVSRVLNSDQRADIRYEYDAVGNVRRILSEYKTATSQNFAIQDLWYQYDSMNRFTVTQGRLKSADGKQGDAARGTGVIEQGDNGVRLTYDYNGQRLSASYGGSYIAGTDAHLEEYKYTADGYLTEVYIDGELRSYRDIDASGRVGRQVQYAAQTGAVLESRLNRYDGWTGKLSEVNVTNKDGNTNQTWYYYDAAGNMTYSLANTNGQAEIATVYQYEYWDSAKQKTIDVTGKSYNTNVSGWLPGRSAFSYDVNGHVASVEVADKFDTSVGNRRFNYLTTAEGQILRRDERIDGQIYRWRQYYYAGGTRVGDVSNDGPSRTDYATALQKLNSDESNDSRYANWTARDSADFDQNYDPISPDYPGSTGSSYTARQGDTLFSVAQAVWGDGSMWYLLADTNGLSGNDPLQEGQVLLVPNKVSNIHHNASTSRVYRPGEAMGEVDPTLPSPPPPKVDDEGCGVFGTIIMVAIAIAVTVALGPGAGAAVVEATSATIAASAATAGAAAGAGAAVAGAAVAAASTFSWAVVGQSMLAAAAGSAASQVAGMAMGNVNSFSWKNVGVAALSAGIGQGLSGVSNAVGSAVSNAGGASWAASAASAAVTSTISMGVISALDLGKFSWKNVAAAAVSSGVNKGLGIDNISGFTGQLTQAFSSNLVSQLVSTGKVDGRELFANTLGNAIGNSIGARLRPPPIVHGQGAQLIAQAQAMQDDLTAPYQKMAADVTAAANRRGVPSLTWESTDEWMKRLASDFRSNADERNGSDVADDLYTSQHGLNAPRYEVTVQAGDNLSKIAAQMYGKNQRAGIGALFDLNGLRSDPSTGNPIIQPGQTLFGHDLAAFDDKTIARFGKQGGEVISYNTAMKEYSQAQALRAQSASAFSLGMTSARSTGDTGSFSDGLNQIYWPGGGISPGLLSASEAKSGRSDPTEATERGFVDRFQGLQKKLGWTAYATPLGGMATGAIAAFLPNLADAAIDNTPYRSQDIGAGLKAQGGNIAVDMGILGIQAATPPLLRPFNVTDGMINYLKGFKTEITPDLRYGAAAADMMAIVGPSAVEMGVVKLAPAIKGLATAVSKTNVYQYMNTHGFMFEGLEGLQRTMGPAFSQVGAVGTWRYGKAPNSTDLMASRVGVEIGPGRFGPNSEMAASMLQSGDVRAKALARALQEGDLTLKYTNLPTGYNGAYRPGTGVLQLNNNLDWSGLSGLEKASVILRHEGQHYLDDMAGIATRGMKNNELYFEARAFLGEQKFANQIGKPELGTLHRLEQQHGSRQAAWEVIKKGYGYGE